MKTKTRTAAKHKDPVCGMKVEGEELQSEYNGKTYYFCCQDCLDKFEEDPEAFV